MTIRSDGVDVFVQRPDQPWTAQRLAQVRAHLAGGAGMAVHGGVLYAFRQAYLQRLGVRFTGETTLAEAMSRVSAAEASRFTMRAFDPPPKPAPPRPTAPSPCAFDNVRLAAAIRSAGFGDAELDAVFQEIDKLPGCGCRQRPARERLFQRLKQRLLALPQDMHQKLLLQTRCSVLNFVTNEGGRIVSHAIR